jgi:hypothetical protein
MNRLLTILLLAAGTAYGQIDNPPTSVNIVDATATGRAVLTATNAAAAATAVGLGATNNVTFSNITANGIVTANDSTATPATNAAAAQGIQWPGLGGSQHAAIYGGYAGAAQIALAVGTSNSLSDVATFRATGMTVNSNAIVGGTLAVTGNVTLSGVNNTAPAQTADSGASLMTRDLSDGRYSFSRWYTGYELVSLDSTTGGVKSLNSGNGSGGIFNNQMVVIPDVNATFNLPVDWRISGQVKIVSYWSDRGATNSGGTNADIAVWSTPFARSPTNNSVLPASVSGTQVQSVFTANYGGAGRAYVVEQTMDFSTVSGISATNPMQIKFVELQRRAADATDTSTNTIWLSGVHIYVP